MNCYEHSNEAAVGICRHCNRGVCASCLEEVLGVVCCSRESCHAGIENEAEIILRASQNQKHLGADFYFSFLMQFVFAIVFLVAGVHVYQRANLSVFGITLLVLSLVFVVLSIRALFRGMVLKKEKREQHRE